MRTWITLACVVALAPFAIATPKTAAKAYKVLQNAALKQYRADNDARLATAFAQIATVDTQLKGALVTPADAIEDVADALGPALAEISAKALQTTVDLVFDADDLLIAEGVATLPGFLPGDGGSGDQFETKIDKELARVRGKVLKRLAQFRKSLAKATAGEFGLTYVVPAIQVNGAPHPTNPASISASDAGMYAPRIVIVLATSSTAVTSDGRIVIGARGYVSATSASTNFYLDGQEVRSSTDVSDPSLFEFGYSHVNFDSLDEGGYRVLFDQDPDHDVNATEFPYERTTIGVP